MSARKASRGDVWRSPWAALRLSTGCPARQEGHNSAQGLLLNGGRQGAPPLERFPSALV